MLPAQLSQSLPSYYDHALSLFGLGWIENRYQFLRNGQVQLQWQTPCISANTH
jgi:endoglucanase